MKHGLSTSLTNWQTTLCANIVAYGELENKPFELDFVTAKIDQHAHSDSGRFKFVEKLRLIGCLIYTGSFEFDDDLLSDEEVGPVIADDRALVDDFDFVLDLGLESACNQLNLHRPLLNFLQKAVSQNGMHFEGGADNLLSNLAVLEPPLVAPRSCASRLLRSEILIRVSSVFHPWPTNGWLRDNLAVAYSFSLPIRSAASIKRGVSTVRVARM